VEAGKEDHVMTLGRDMPRWVEIEWLMLWLDTMAPHEYQWRPLVDSWRLS
jgi:hypothetical protein